MDEGWAKSTRDPYTPNPKVELARVDSLWQRKKCRDCALVDMVDGRKQF